jgi:hypothetical protein
MVCISKGYRFTVFIPFYLKYLGKENQGQGRDEGNVRSEVRFSELLLLLHFSGYYLLTSLRFLQYHGSRFCATYHSSSSRQNILSTSYGRNTKVQAKQRFHRGFRRIDSSKSIYRITINKI